MQIVLNRLEKLRRVGQKFGPYLVLEMLLPGGTLARAAALPVPGRKARYGGNRGTRWARGGENAEARLRHAAPLCALARACLSSRRTRHVRRRFFVGIVTTELSISGPAIRL